MYIPRNLTISTEAIWLVCIKYILARVNKLTPLCTILLLLHRYEILLKLNPDNTKLRFDEKLPWWKAKLEIVSNITRAIVKAVSLYLFSLKKNIRKTAGKAFIAIASDKKIALTINFFLL